MEYDLVDFVCTFIVLYVWWYFRYIHNGGCLPILERNRYPAADVLDRMNTEQHNPDEENERSASLIAAIGSSDENTADDICEENSQIQENDTDSDEAPAFWGPHDLDLD